ncbi:ABC transporter substrate-binding protein [Pseudomonas daroniae]|uniref:ABC transporter substrate-binding protein n=1 Tax=Phytopseudomonas daroniae TaxID=2487519 RepID=A0A4Q9QF03_9GAMM|nr:MULTISPECIES: ABC transporter substrate-binding protein [Pseudomonas]TBU71068.1 ABC transporter substrate-binding protein [Pseudomonas daroniae]TBU71212.1 ABC transporter substrate-binding protein [Pseudomonas daroniae]TBU73748.1 ABC transporter substrate-binding protein [Pseudomonas sp. FRB 228]TBU86675.1 ABC transporter substrate-binding protein [Pseudomonas daroniae]
MIRGFWLALLLSFTACAQASNDLPANIRMASDVWVDRINADGTGLSWDVLRLVFEPAGVKLDMQIVPYTRSVGLVKRGEADAWVASYQDEVSGGVVYPTWHYDSDLISALSLASKPQPDQQALASSRLVWMRGYEYQRYIPGLTHYNELLRRGGILPMLDYDHADYYIDAQPEVQEVLAGASDTSKYRVTDLIRLPLYIGFADTSRGRALAKLYDQRMAELVEQDALRPVFERWGQHYPFD